MTAPSVTTSGPKPSSEWNTREWINYIHAASTVSQSDPNYELAHQSALRAAGRLGELNQQLSVDDPERLRPGAISTFMVALGNGASLGLLGKADDARMYLQAGRDAGHGLAAAAGNLAGAGAITALTGAGLAAAAPALSSIAVGALSGTVTGAIQGAATAEPGSRGMGAVTGGGIGLLLGAGGGYLAGKVLPVLQRVPWAGKFFGASEIDAAEGQLRNELRAQGYNRTDVSKAASAWRSAQAREAVIHFEANRAFDATRQTLTARGVPAEQATQRASEAARNAVRRSLINAGVDPSKVDAAAEGYLTGGQLSVRSPAVPERIRAIQAQTGQALSPEDKVTLIQRTVPVPPESRPNFLRPIAGTEGRGLEATGTRATPAVPANKPTLAEMTGMANLQTSPSVPRINREELGYQPRQVWNWAEAHGMDPNDPATREILKAASRRGSPSWMKDWDPRQGLGIALTLGAAASSARSR